MKKCATQKTTKKPLHSAFLIYYGLKSRWQRSIQIHGYDKIKSMMHDFQKKCWRRCKANLSSASVKSTLLAIAAGGGLRGNSAKLNSEKNLCANLAMSAGTRATVSFLLFSSRVAANDFFCCNCPDDAVAALFDLSWEMLLASLQLLTTGEGNRGSFLRFFSAVPST